MKKLPPTGGREQPELVASSQTSSVIGRSHALVGSDHKVFPITERTCKFSPRNVGVITEIRDKDVIDNDTLFQSGSCRKVQAQDDAAAESLQKMPSSDSMCFFSSDILEDRDLIFWKTGKTDIKPFFVGKPSTKSAASCVRPRNCP